MRERIDKPLPSRSVVKYASVMFIVALISIFIIPLVLFLSIGKDVEKKPPLDSNSYKVTFDFYK